MSNISELSSISFVDLFGFSGAVETATLQNNQTRIDSLLRLIKNATDPNNEVTVANYGQTHRYKRTAFSDCIVMSNSKEQAERTIVQSYILASMLAKFGFMCRGGITIGNLTHDADIVFGVGLIRAHHLESKVAKKPIIILDNEIFTRDLCDSYGPQLRSILKYDESISSYYINQFIGSPTKIFIGIELDETPYWQGLKKGIETLKQIDIENKHAVCNKWLSCEFNLHKPQNIQGIST